MDPAAAENEAPAADAAATRAEATPAAEPAVGNAEVNATSTDSADEGKSTDENNNNAAAAAAEDAEDAPPAAAESPGETAAATFNETSEPGTTEPEAAATAAVEGENSSSAPTPAPATDPADDEAAPPTTTSAVDAPADAPEATAADASSSSSPVPPPPAIVVNIAAPNHGRLSIVVNDEDDSDLGHFAATSTHEAPAHVSGGHSNDDDDDDDNNNEGDEEDAADAAAADALKAQLLRAEAVAQLEEVTALRRSAADAVQRRALLEELAALQDQTRDAQFQRRMAEQSLAELFARQKLAPAALDRDARYDQTITALAALEEEHAHARAAAAEAAHRLRIMLDRDNAMTLDMNKSLVALQHETFRKCASESTAKPLPLAVLKEMEEKDALATAQLSAARTRIIALQHGIEQTEGELSALDRQTDGVHLMRYEQLKIENHGHLEKIEERNDDIQKLRAKVTGVLQVLTHLKEKLHFIETEAHDQRALVLELERDLARKRDELSRTKRVRDKFRAENIELKNRCGLVGNTRLLRDFEERHDASALLAGQLETLKTRYAELGAQAQGYRTKMSQLTASGPLRL